METTPTGPDAIQLGWIQSGIHYLLVFIHSASCCRVTTYIIVPFFAILIGLGYYVGQMEPTRPSHVEICTQLDKTMWQNARNESEKFYNSSLSSKHGYIPPKWRRDQIKDELETAEYQRMIGEFTEAIEYQLWLHRISEEIPYLILTAAIVVSLAAN